MAEAWRGIRPAPASALQRGRMAAGYPQKQIGTGYSNRLGLFHADLDSGLLHRIYGEGSGYVEFADGFGH